MTDFTPRLRALVNSEAAICMVPGNHDVKWGLDPEISNFFNQKFAAFKEVADTDYLPLSSRQWRNAPLSWAKPSNLRVKWLPVVLRD